MGKISFPDFWKYYKGTPEQKEAVVLLESMMPTSLLQDDSSWVIKYREQPAKPSGLVTAQMMHELTGHPASSFDDVFVNDCNRLFADTGFDAHLDAMQMLMANMMHETANFVYMKEIASGAAYNGRADLGNTSPGDGEKYKGAGVLQLTGKFNYQRLSDGINDPRVMEGVDYVANTYPFTSAQVWIIENNLLEVCLKQGFDACCYRINGGWNGIEDRTDKYKTCKRVMHI